MNVRDLLRGVLTNELAQEGITPEVLNMVDLEMAYSPVLACRGDTIDAAVSVQPWGCVPKGVLPEKFEVRHPLVRLPVDRAELKVMRARYLLAQDAYHGFPTNMLSDYCPGNC